jgi:hypothetical protein
MDKQTKKCMFTFLMSGYSKVPTEDDDDRKANIQLGGLRQRHSKSLAVSSKEPDGPAKSVEPEYVKIRQLSRQIQHAAKQGDFKTVHELTMNLKANDFKAFDNVRTKSKQLEKAISDVDFGAIKTLVREGADPDTEDDGLTALIWASHRGNLDCMRVLLQHGANVNFCTWKKKLVALYEASNAGQYDAVQLLLESGADPFVKDGLALQMAKNEKIQALLAEAMVRSASQNPQS